MRTSCVKNGLVVGIILLFVGVALSPVITAVDNDTDDDVNDEPIDNSDEMEASDEYEEIITFIEGSWWTDAPIGFYFGSIEMWSYLGENDIWGIRRRTGKPFDFLFRERVVYINARLFIGNLFGMMPGHEIVSGIALGNIEWS